MHRALYIEEILLNIFRFCYTYRHPAIKRQLSYANADLAALARTCKIFKEPALDMIWAELEDLTPLVRCLPETSWVKSGDVYSLKKPLQQSDWDIILGYARRVRALPHLHGSLGLSPDCFEELSKPPTSVFPNLGVVKLHRPHAAIAPFVRHLSNPGLTNLLLAQVENLGAAIDAFGEQCPAVTSFVVPYARPLNPDTILGLLFRWQNLSLVDCYPVDLNVNVLIHLSRSRNLSYLTFTVPDAVIDRPTQTSIRTLTFLALRDLRLKSGSLTPVSRLFHHLSVPGIYNLTINLHTRPTASDLMSFFVDLQEACTCATLGSILFQVYHATVADGSSLQNSPPPYYITFDCLRPLTAFMNVTSIIFDIPCGVHLNEHELLCLASSWPRLEKFVLGKNYDWMTSSAITPGGFLQLIERCRSLRVLHFMFDTRGYTEIPQGHPWRGLTMPKNTVIHVCKCPIEEESIEALGVFFHVAPYPDFVLMTYLDGLFFGGRTQFPQLSDVYHDRWAKVCTLASDLWKKRRDLRRSLETRFS